MMDGLSKAEDDVSEEEANNPQDDTRRSVWQSHLAAVRSKSKPNFFFYLNGLLRRKIAGVETYLVIILILFFVDRSLPR